MSLKGALDPIYRNGSIWDRLEEGQPDNYWEENAVIGRRGVQKKLIDWMSADSVSRVLDAGCGRGVLSFRLARRGFSVTAVDLYPRFSERIKGLANVTIIRGDFRKIFVTRQPIFDALVLSEVIEEYPPMERDRLFEWICRIPFDRLYLVFKTGGPADSLLDRVVVRELRHTLDAVRLLRSVHLRTPYRLEKKEEIKVRNYRALVAAFKSPERNERSGP